MSLKLGISGFWLTKLQQHLNLKTSLRKSNFFLKRELAFLWPGFNPWAAQMIQLQVNKMPDMLKIIR